MFRYLMVVWLVFVGYANAGLNYINVTSTGETFEQAKVDAFRKAIEFKVGVTVMSDTEIKNYKVAKKDIYLYSAGYVDDYKIISQNNTGNGVVLSVDVLVSESKIKNRILAEGKSSKDFGGDRHNAQISTYLQERLQGDNLINKAVSGYPSKAFNIKQFDYKISFDIRRNLILYIPYELSWNLYFIKSLRETTGLIENCNPVWNKPCASAITIMSKNPDDIVIGSRSDHYFNDLVRIDQLYRAFVQNQPRIVVGFYDVNDTLLYGTCRTPKFIWGGSSSFYNVGSKNQIVIFGNAKEKDNIQLTVPLQVIENTTTVKLTIEPENVCQIK